MRVDEDRAAEAYRRGLDIDNHDANTITFQTGVLSSTGTSNGIRIQNSNGGAINFNNPTKTLNTGGSNAVTLSSNSGKTISFGNGGLAITTDVLRRRAPIRLCGVNR